VEKEDPRKVGAEKFREIAGGSRQVGGGRGRRRNHE